MATKKSDAGKQVVKKATTPAAKPAAKPAPAAPVAGIAPEIKAFKTLLQKHKVVAALLRDAHYLQRQHVDVQNALHTLVENYDIGALESVAPITNSNRRDLVLRDLHVKLKNL